jgi:mannose-6-phosphate isomerase-like protein (cupin superfamily)
VIVVETADAVLVASRSQSQDVKLIVNQLEAQQREEKNLHRKVARPWGWYDSVDEGERFKVKRIQVKPGASLSLQMHHHRAEHWIVVKGTAEITNGDKVITLTENQSTYIPQGQTHRLANPGKTPLEIIEVQSGSYLGEDDIVRFEDTMAENKSASMTQKNSPHLRRQWSGRQLFSSAFTQQRLCRFWYFTRRARLLFFEPSKTRHSRSNYLSVDGAGRLSECLSCPA